MASGTSKHLFVFHSFSFQALEHALGPHNSVFPQVVSGLRSDLNDRSIASFMEWGGQKASTFDAWTGFTTDWLSQRPNNDDTVAWIPRIRPGEFSNFEVAEQDGFPALTDGIAISRMLDSEGEVKTEENVTAAIDRWPILYVNPRNDSVLGFDISSDPILEHTIEQMLEGNSTAITEKVIFPGDGQSGFLVLQPVFNRSRESEEVVGCISKETRVTELLVNILRETPFEQRYPGASIDLYLRVNGVQHLEGDIPSEEDQFLVGLQAAKTESREAFAFASQFINAPDMETVAWVEPLTASRAIVMVSTFEPRYFGTASAFALLVGCLFSFFVAIVIRSKQSLLLTYKNSMEEARIHSGFTTRFVANTSHEIRTTLNGIMGTGELLAEQELPPAAMELVDIMQACGRMLMDT